MCLLGIRYVPVINVVSTWVADTFHCICLDFEAVLRIKKISLKKKKKTIKLNAENCEIKHFFSKLLCLGHLQLSFTIVDFITFLFTC